jgi:hypothetical protein
VEVYGQVVGTGFSAPEAVLLGLLLLFVGFVYKSESFERLVGSRVRGPLLMAYGTFGLPLALLMLRKATGSRGGGIGRFILIFILIVIVVIIGVLALVAYLIYRFVRRRR